MGYTSVEVKAYRCALFSQNDNPAKLSFYDAGGTNFATAFLRPDDENLPKAFQDPGGMYRLYYRRSVLPELIDLLRNEKPVYVHFWEGPGDNAHVATWFEPVGEEEA